MRNELFNDTELDEELDKFSAKYYSIMEEFNKPLQDMMIKRSQYKIMKKSSLKDGYLTLFRDKRDAIKGLMPENKKLEFELFHKMNNLFNDKKNLFFKRIASLSQNSLVKTSIDTQTYFET